MEHGFAMRGGTMRKTLDEAAVKQILDRAVQLDAERSGSLEPDQVRAIAADLGISREAVDVALAEYQDTLVTTEKRGFLTRRKLVVAGVVGTVVLLGALVAGARTHPSEIVVTIPEISVPAPPPSYELPPRIIIRAPEVPRPVTPVPPAPPVPPQPARVRR